jgi:hypothetical protein
MSLNGMWIVGVGRQSTVAYHLAFHDAIFIQLLFARVVLGTPYKLKSGYPSCRLFFV